MSTSSIHTDPRARRWGNFAKYSALFMGCVIIAPFTLLAIGGLLGLIVFGAIIGATWMLRPWVYAVAANTRLRLVKAEAARNPVETLQEDLRAKTVALDERKTNIEKLNGQIRTFADKVDDIKARYGAQDGGYVKLSADLNDLKRIYKHRCDKWREARAQLDRYAEEIDRANMIWEAGRAAAAARETSGLTEAEFFAKLKTETAFDSIQISYNEALASLDTSMLDEPIQQAALPAADSRATINVTPPVMDKVNG